MKRCGKWSEENAPSFASKDPPGFLYDSDAYDDDLPRVEDKGRVLDRGALVAA